MEFLSPSDISRIRIFSKIRLLQIRTDISLLKKVLPVRIFPALMRRVMFRMLFTDKRLQLREAVVWQPWMQKNILENWNNILSELKINTLSVKLPAAFFCLRFYPSDPTHSGCNY